MSYVYGRRVGIAGWIALVVLAVVIGLLMGMRPSPSTVALILVTCVAPPLVMMRVWRGAPPPTIGEVIERVERSR